MTKALGQPENLKEQTDEQLLIAYRGGKGAAFEELLHRYERELYNYLRRYLGDSSLAEDVFQHTFLQLHLKKDLYQEGHAVRPWLYTIATHQAIDMLRRVARHATVSLDSRARADLESSHFSELLEGSELDPVDELQGAERRTWVRSAVQRLPEYFRSVLEMAYFRGMKQREIAEALEIPVGTVKSRLHAAVAKLAQLWKQRESVAIQEPKSHA